MRLILLSLFALSCYAGEATSTIPVTTTPLNVYPHVDTVSGKRFLVFVLNGPNGQQQFQVVEATKPLPPPPQIPVYLAPLLSLSPVPAVVPSQKKIDLTNLNVEASEIIEKTQTFGNVPPGWRTVRVEQTNSGPLKHIERIRILK